MGQERKSILIVDDDPEICRFLLKILAANDLDIAACHTGQDASELMGQTRYDLVLLDLGLPDCHGLELLERFHGQGAKQFLIITADDTSESLLSAIKKQAYGYVRKPFDRHEIVDLVEEALEAPEVPPIEVISAKPDWLELSVPCSRSAAERIQQFMRQMEPRLPDETASSISQCFRELLMNAVEWGGQLDSSRRVRIAYLHTPRMVQYRIADPGPGFQTDHLEHAAAGQQEGDVVTHTRIRDEKGIRQGGFGLLMVRAMSDELIYNEKQNEVVFIKYLDPEKTPL
jgi:CheY-like chemotaxis protein/anti-sigma regulatory factor (Ser/Thr protein kinase)